MSATVNAVVFDIGNVLIRWDPRHLYRKLFTHADMTADDRRVDWFLSTVCTEAWNLEQDRGRPIAEAVEEAIGRHSDYAAHIRSFYGRFQEMIPGEIPQTVAALRRAKAAGIPVHGLTNFCAETFPATASRFDFLRCFDTVVVSGEEGVIKPDPAIFELLIDRAGLDPSSTAFIDDSAANIATAQELGFVSHRFNDPTAFEAWWVGNGLPA
ncbi:MAG: HAD family phosphatase [Alphaproteobacteria bacterium]|nr:HAD family phosphatase [Alphaproteobacteria bacterium]